MCDNTFRGEGREKHVPGITAKAPGDSILIKYTNFVSQSKGSIMGLDSGQIFGA